MLDEGATTAYQPSSPVRPTLSELADGARRPAFVASRSDATLIGQCCSSSRVAARRAGGRALPLRRKQEYGAPSRCLLSPFNRRGSNLCVGRSSPRQRGRKAPDDAEAVDARSLVLRSGGVLCSAAQRALLATKRLVRPTFGPGPTRGVPSEGKADQGRVSCAKGAGRLRVGASRPCCDRRCVLICVRSVRAARLRVSVRSGTGVRESSICALGHWLETVKSRSDQRVS